MPSRGDGISQLLCAPGEFSTRSVPPSGDCFYDCLDLQLGPDRPPALRDALAMRHHVAESLTEDLFSLYQQFAAAGVDDFAWLLHHRAPSTLEEFTSPPA